VNPFVEDPKVDVTLQKQAASPEGVSDIAFICLRARLFNKTFPTGIADIPQI